MICKNFLQIAFILTLCTSTHAATINYNGELSARGLIIDAEGLIKGNYTDSLGYKHCWYGFNDKYHPCDDIKNINQAQSYLNKLIIIASEKAKQYHNSPNPSINALLIDLYYNIGHRLHQFKKMRERLIQHDYEGAAYELEKSTWCEQTKTRCQRNVKIMKRLKNGGSHAH